MTQKKNFKIGIVGATGKVGKVFLSLILERQFPFSELRLFASQKSQGKKLRLKEKEYKIDILKKGCFQGLDLVFFSSGDEISRLWAKEALRAKAFVVDNSAAFRMSPDHVLVVPEINAHLLPSLHEPSIIANPNCSTIQLVLTLFPLAQDFGLEQVHVATYQAVSGAGQKGEEELLKQLTEKIDRIKKNTELLEEETPSFYDQENLVDQKEKKAKERVFPHPIAFNCVPQIGSFNEEGFCSEEMKIMNETRKILNSPDLGISAFSVRVPSWNAHGEAVWVRLSKEVNRNEFISSLKKNQALRLHPHLGSQASYPHPLQVSGQDKVEVGRIHRDLFDKKTWILWIVGDNLKKGAALNGLQIAETLFHIHKNPEF